MVLTNITTMFVFGFPQLRFFFVYLYLYLFPMQAADRINLESNTCGFDLCNMPMTTIEAENRTRENVIEK